MRHALRQVRTWAGEGVPLTFDRLVELQQMIVDGPGEFRSADAYAHQGRERYGLQPDTFEAFREALAEAMDAGVPVCRRAALLYLDICYFHPFSDGNARLARLGLDYVLSVENLALQRARPVFLVARRGTDPWPAQALQRILDYLAGPRSD